MRAYDNANKTLAHEVDHLHNFWHAKFVEHDHFVNAVQELWTEVALQGFVHLVAHACV